MIEKIDEDFAGALNHWPEFMKVWTFVHNCKKGLPAPVAQHMDEMRRGHPGIAIQTWCEPHLLDLFDTLTENAKRTLFGPVPDPTTANDMTLDDIEPVVEKLESLPLEVAEGPLPAPTLEKLEKNELSNYVKILLRNGRLKDRLVRKYFEKGLSSKRGSRSRLQFGPNMPSAKFKA